MNYLRKIQTFWTIRATPPYLVSGSLEPVNHTVIATQKAAIIAPNATTKEANNQILALVDTPSPNTKLLFKSFQLTALILEGDKYEWGNEGVRGIIYISSIERE